MLPERNLSLASFWCWQAMRFSAMQLKFRAYVIITLRFINFRNLLTGIESRSRILLCCYAHVYIWIKLKLFSPQRRLIFGGVALRRENVSHSWKLLYLVFVSSVTEAWKKFWYLMQSFNITQPFHCNKISDQTPRLRTKVSIVMRGCNVRSENLLSDKLSNRMMCCWCNAEEALLSARKGCWTDDQYFHLTWKSHIK